MTTSAEATQPKSSCSGQRRRYRLVIWGPGEIGGDTLRAAQASEEFEIVGVKVFSPHKNGVDAGELVGIDPIGVRATTSKEEILALDADCVILTPIPTSILEGLDDDVIEILESGKDVVTTAAYHNVGMPNWLNVARTPTARLRAVSRIRGVAQSTTERRALALARVLTNVPALDRFTDPLLRTVVEKRIPVRATPERLIAACRTGGASLYGTGVHPAYMVERQMVRLAQAVRPVKHIRFVETANMGSAPEGMWGGIEMFGYGSPIEQVGNDHLLAVAGDFYYGDMIGNVAHALYGAHPREVRVERALQALPARYDFKVGSVQIRAGTAAAMRLTHRGYLGDHHFFTNEECWYLGSDHSDYGPDVDPVGPAGEGAHQFEITGRDATIRGNRTYARVQEGVTHPLTRMSARTMLDAVPALADSPPGVYVDDASPHYRLANAGAA